AAGAHLCPSKSRVLPATDGERAGKADRKDRADRTNWAERLIFRWFAGVWRPERCFDEKGPRGHCRHYRDYLSTISVVWFPGILDSRTALPVLRIHHPGILDTVDYLRQSSQLH